MLWLLTIRVIATLSANPQPRRCVRRCIRKAIMYRVYCVQFKIRFRIRMFHAANIDQIWMTSDKQHAAPPNPKLMQPQILYPPGLIEHPAEIRTLGDTFFVVGGL